MSPAEARIAAADAAGWERADDMAIIPAGLTHLPADAATAAKDTETTEKALLLAWPEIHGSGFADDPVVEPRGAGEFACRACFLIKLNCQHIGDGYCVDCVDEAVLS